MAMSIEKDGTFTNFDRTVQRLRGAVPPMGEAMGGVEIVGRLARRLGYDLNHGHTAQVMGEIARLVPGYRGLSYARLERGGMTVPSGGFADGGEKVLRPGGSGIGQIAPQLVPVNASNNAVFGQEAGTPHV
jgi:predicted molibdopterin-dependent oxidoreductase YjgC